MVQYAYLIFTTLLKSIIYKQGAMAVYSLLFSFIVTTAETILEWEFLGISYSFLMLAVVLIMTDFVTGSLASRHEIFENSGERTGWFESNKITFTVYKFLSILLVLWLSTEIHDYVEDAHNDSTSDFWKPVYMSAQNSINVIRTTVFTLICAREYISIGENIKRRFGKTYYAFYIFERIFDIIELKFIKKIEEK